MSSLARDVAIAGVGFSEFTRAGDPSPRALTFRAVQDALDDAGLRGADVDGIFEYKFGPESPGAQDAARLIGAPDLAAFSDLMPSNPSGLGGVLSGVMAVASGVCETAVVFRCMTRAAGHTGGVKPDGAEVVDNPSWDQYTEPYGCSGGILVTVAMLKQRLKHELGRTEEHFGSIAVNARRWAALNPRAVLPQPLTMDDYLESRMVADPLRLLDCDYPITGAAAAVITTAERARDLRQRPVVVDAMSYGTGAQVSWLFSSDFLYGGMPTCSNRLWSRASVTAADVDVAQLYDGFTMTTTQWVEALGFCGIGEFGDWVGDGSRIGPGGDLPVNTSGGQLAEGRMHALGFLNEAVLQLRGQCDARQVAGAEVAVVAAGLNPQCGAMLLVGG